MVRTVLSQNTSDHNSLAAFDLLKRAYPSWSGAAAAPASEIASHIRHAGLANIKAVRIRDLLNEIRRREGRMSLSRLKTVPVDEATAYLRSFKGVGPKTAACVLLFSFRKPVMPVDTHIFRVAKRLGLVVAGANPEEAHRVFARIVPNNLKYDFHLAIIEHGRKTCKAQNPRCGSCVLYALCAFADKQAFARKTRSAGGS